jgi:hypothetical protein
MEIQPLLTGQRAKINIDRPSESVLACKTLFLHALEIPERIADVLKIKVHTTLLQASPLTAPGSKKMAVRTLPRFVTVRAGDLFLLHNLGMDRKCKHTETAPR